MFIVKNDEDDKVFGLCLGVDDYLIKLFSINEFMVCVNFFICWYIMLNFVFIIDIDCIIINGMIIDKIN